MDVRLTIVFQRPFVVKLKGNLISIAESGVRGKIKSLTPDLFSPPISKETSPLWNFLAKPKQTRKLRLLKIWTNFIFYFLYLSFCPFVLWSFFIFCHFAFLSLCLFVILPFCHFVFLSLCLFVTLFFCHFVCLSLCLFVTCLFVTLSLRHFVFLLLCLFVLSPVDDEADMTVHLSFFIFIMSCLNCPFFPFFRYLLMVRQM